MSCCNQKREGYQQTSKENTGKNIYGYNAPGIWKDVSFKYIGKSALTIRGVVTGKVYRFSKPDDIQVVDYRDVRSMFTMPLLRSM